MDELTIEQTKDVLGMSYPTALIFAKANGRMRDRKWIIPAHVIWDELQVRRADLDERESQLKRYCLNYPPSYNPEVNGGSRPVATP